MGIADSPKANPTGRHRRRPPHRSIQHGLAGIQRHPTYSSCLTATGLTLVALRIPAIGLDVPLGIAMWPAAAAGAVLTVMMWSAVLPPANNPFMDDYLIYAAVLVLLAVLGAGRTVGLGRLWAATPLVRRAPWLT